MSSKQISACIFSREGRNQYEKAFGVDAKDLFQALYRFVENTPTHSFIFPLCFFILSLSVSLSTLPPKKKKKKDSWNLLGGAGVCDGGDGGGGVGVGVFRGSVWWAVM